MLHITIPEGESWDEKNEVFITTKPVTLKMEHSLLSLSKWEFKYEKPFLDPRTKITYREQLDYFKCMTISPNVDDTIYLSMPRSTVDEITDYINKKATATWINSRKNGKAPSRTIWTSELIYFQMIQCGIPFECEKWHLNRLIMLIRVCQEETNKQKMSTSEIRARNKKLNAARKARHHTHG